MPEEMATHLLSSQTEQRELLDWLKTKQLKYILPGSETKVMQWTQRLWSEQVVRALRFFTTGLMVDGVCTPRIDSEMNDKKEYPLSPEAQNESTHLRALDDQWAEHCGGKLLKYNGVPENMSTLKTEMGKAAGECGMASDVELYKAVDDGVKVGFLGPRLVYICGEDHATLYGGGGCGLNKDGMMLVIR